MPRMADSILMEIDQEAAATRRILERVPADRQDWRPHAKSMTLGQLATHIATLPGGIVKVMMVDTFEAPSGFSAPPVVPVSELILKLEESVRGAKDIVSTFDDERMMATWKMRMNGKDAFAAPRGAVLRSFMLNHWYHHRGQLTVYLRLLDVPVPAIYGPSADENPFANL